MFVMVLDLEVDGSFWFNKKLSLTSGNTLHEKKTNSDHTVGPMRLFPVSIVIVQKTLVHVLSAMCEQSERERMAV